VTGAGRNGNHPFRIWQFLFKLFARAPEFLLRAALPVEEGLGQKSWVVNRDGFSSIRPVKSWQCCKWTGNPSTNGQVKCEPEGHHAQS
jgi:hypothetical protein